MTQQAVARRDRIPGLETIETLPIFFAINDGQHPRSIMIVEKLRESYPDEGGEIPDVRCFIFKSTEEAAAKVSANAVLIFDNEQGKNCFTPLYRGKQPCATLWGVAVNRQLKPERVATVANQLRADFDKHFFKRLDEGLLPWGESRSPSNARKRRQAERKRHHRNGRRERYPYF